MNYKDFCVSAIKTIDAKFNDETLQTYGLINDSLILREKESINDINDIIKCIAC